MRFISVFLLLISLSLAWSDSQDFRYETEVMGIDGKSRIQRHSGILGILQPDGPFRPDLEPIDGIVLWAVPNSQVYPNANQIYLQCSKPPVYKGLIKMFTEDNTKYSQLVDLETLRPLNGIGKARYQFDGPLINLPGSYSTQCRKRCVF